jgi:gamma-glutamyltranspeptidase/glutathione hydrolase
MQSRGGSRRTFLRQVGAGAIVCPFLTRAGQAARQANTRGIVVGQPAGERVGMQVLADGGNAIDAIVAASLAAAIAAPHSTGIGGYGMSAVIATSGGKRIVAIDGNSTAPMSTPTDLFQPDSRGRLPDGFSTSNSLSSIGWQSAGVPGILAGLQLALDRFGTRRFGELVQPAIALARDGIPLSKTLANTIRGNKMFPRDRGSQRLFYPEGKLVGEGGLFRNPDLAAMLSELARNDSVEAFYRGDIGMRIADGFQKNGGLVTAKDMASYRARIAEPLRLDSGENTVVTAPLTAGGLSVLQMLRAMDSMKWGQLTAGFQRTHARVEAMRLAWRDRLTLLGDPDFVKNPTDRLLSKEYADESAERIMAAVKRGEYLAHRVHTRPHTGTIHLSAADIEGNFVALTLTHGNGFGACVTVEGLGLTLGHGLSRFDPTPGHPNGPEPGKRPLHNMVPTLILRRGEPVLAVGGTGGRKIPSSLFDVLTQFVLLDQTISKSIAAPRICSEGTLSLAFEKTWPSAETDEFGKLGYTIRQEAGASMNAVALENGELVRAAR